MAAPVYGLVLAGGLSRRMLQDKAFLRYHNLPQYLHIYRMLQQICTEVFISCRPKQAEKFSKLHPEISLIPDQYKNIGPMAALLSAFHQHETAWLTLACDMPFMDLPTLKLLLKERDSSAIATTYRLSGNDFPESMCTIWEPMAFSRLEQNRQQEQYSLIHFLKHQKVGILIPNKTDALKNVNTPEEYAEIMKILKKGKLKVNGN